MASFRICIDARLVSGTSGGVEQVIIGLANGLSVLDDGDDEFLFLAYEGADEWLRPHMRGPCQILTDTRPSGSLTVRLIQKYPLLRVIWHRVVSPVMGVRSVKIPKSNGIIERAGIDLMHFTLQTAFLTSIPSIYMPHDLQHLHLPDLFTPRERLKHETLYRTFCAQAHTVVALSQWGKRNLLTHYALDDDKVVVVPHDCMLEGYPTPQEGDITAVRQKFSLPETFLLYPAYSWPHKNHIGLLDALVRLRDREGVRIPVVFSGGQSAFFNTILRHIRAYRLNDQVICVGFVSSLELVSLYQASTGMIFPSRFEGWGPPILEAFAAGVPVACSNIPPLSDLVGDAALLFDPHDPAQIADAAAKLWLNPNLRHDLITRGKRRAQAFTWVRTARLFRAHYRQILNRPLSLEDISLLAAESEV